MLQRVYPCKLLWRSSSDFFRNGASPYSNVLINPVKYMCVQSANSFQEKDGLREIPVKIKSKPLKTQISPPQTQTQNTESTYSDEEVNKFRSMAASWWDKEGCFKPLHSLNKLRVSLIRDGLIQNGVANPDYAKGPYPLKGLRILDIGCGGGILCEPLARLGAEVTGLDPAEENISVAKLHSEKDKRVASNTRFIQGTIEMHAQDSLPYDAIVASEVVEHVVSIDLFLNSCISILKPGGSFFITTINKTTRSWLGAIIAAEYLLALVPRGTHDWNKFVPPNDLKVMLDSGGCLTSLVHGMAYVPFRNEWFWVPDSSINYALHAVKRSGPD